MIIDKIENAHLYKGISKGIAMALEFLAAEDLGSLENGKYVIDGEDVYANVSSYNTREQDRCSWEAHKRYIDVQCMVKGVERIGYANIGNLDVVKEYDADFDFMALSGMGDYLVLDEGTFAVFFPEDAHMPGITASDDTNVKKVVVKVRV
jgi:YhcH/YjgK/YiaL family protein